MEASDITGICLGLAGLIYICRRNWVHRITGALFAVAGISQLQNLLEPGVMVVVFLVIPLAATVWILRATDKKGNKAQIK